jgi:hypothetical protein
MAILLLIANQNFVKSDFTSRREHKKSLKRDDFTVHLIHIIILTSKHISKLSF